MALFYDAPNLLATSVARTAAACAGVVRARLHTFPAADHLAPSRALVHTPLWRSV